MRKLFDNYRHMKIRHKLSFMIALIVIAAFAFTLIVQQYAFSVYDGVLYDKSSQVLNLSSVAIETELKQVEQDSYNMVVDPQIQSLLQEIKNSTSDYERIRLHRDVVDRLLRYSGSNMNLYSIIIIDSLGVEHDAGNLNVIDAKKKKRLILLADEADGRMNWMFPDSNDQALIAVREIRSYQNTNFDLESLGTLIIRVNIDRIVRQSASGIGDLVIFSDGGIAYPQKTIFDSTVINETSFKNNNYITRDIKGSKYFISHIRSPATGWIYLNITPYNQIFQQVIFIKTLIIIVFSVIFALVILWGIQFSRGLTKPIETLMGRMKLAEKGNFAEVNVLIAGDAAMRMDEIGLLHRTFRIMIERINTLITENYANQLLIRETEFMALQAQINPHFLYNTLDSVNWLAKVNNQTQISQMVEALGFLLRNSMSLNEPILTLGDELEMVGNYVTIQKFRFEERLVFTMGVEEQFYSCPVPKLTLQPLLENAIQYALEPAIGICRINIDAQGDGDTLTIVVEDNGPGMANDTLERLRSGKLEAKGKGIGLLNIDDRIKIAFGHRYGLRIDGESGKGTRISIDLPYGSEV